MKRLMLIGLLTIANHVFAESAAKVLFTQKSVTVSGNGGSHALSRGASLSPGDQIVTAANEEIKDGGAVKIKN